MIKDMQAALAGVFKEPLDRIVDGMPERLAKEFIFTWPQQNPAREIPAIDAATQRTQEKK